MLTRGVDERDARDTLTATALGEVIVKPKRAGAGVRAVLGEKHDPSKRNCAAFVFAGVAFSLVTPPSVTRRRARLDAVSASKRGEPNGAVAVAHTFRGPTELALKEDVPTDARGTPNAPTSGTFLAPAVHEKEDASEQR